MKRLTIYGLSLLLSLLIPGIKKSFAQTMFDPFQLKVEAIPMNGMPAIHSFSWAKWENKWLLIGGRTNGLHGFQPPFAFPTANQNTNIYVIDPDSGMVWSISATTLPQQTREHITSSNQQFSQKDSFLYITGGYGYESNQNMLLTFPAITRVNVPEVITAIIQQQPLYGFFSTNIDERMAVTGGHMVNLNSTFYLVMGHRFDGRYNPHNGPSFTQTYTESIQSFFIDDSSGLPVIHQYVQSIDTANFHRRDYNLVPRIFNGNTPGFTAFTGVFQKAVDLPWLSSVDIINGSGVLNSTYEQKLNQYHTANVSLYDSISGENFALFFGGMGLYYPDINNLLIVDSLVPFVNTISYIRSNSIGTTEGWFSNRMPGYLGSSAEFIPADLQEYDNEVIKLHTLDTGWTTVGYVVGGIVSDQPNTFMQATGTTWASDTVYRITINRSTVTFLQEQPVSYLDSFSLFPNPVSQKITVEWQSKQTSHLQWVIYRADGSKVMESKLKKYGIGNNQETIQVDTLAPTQYIIYFLENGNAVKSLKFIKE